MISPIQGGLLVFFDGGNEGKGGLSDTLAKKATDYIRIPMSESAESLNVAMATGILIYEVVRQRNMY